jgi:hypothetical protein
VFQRFTTTLSDGSVVALCRGGADRDVTRANVAEYVERVTAARLGESRLQVRVVLCLRTCVA